LCRETERHRDRETERHRDRDTKRDRDKNHLKTITVLTPMFVEKEEDKINKSIIVIGLVPMYSSLFLVCGFIIKMVGIQKFLFGLYLLIGTFAIPATMNLVYMSRDK
jgi:hypothetical protein